MRARGVELETRRFGHASRGPCVGPGTVRGIRRLSEATLWFSPSGRMKPGVSPVSKGIPVVSFSDTVDINAEAEKQTDIGLGSLVCCGYCVEVCPEDAIRINSGIFDMTAYSREAQAGHP